MLPPILDEEMKQLRENHRRRIEHAVEQGEDRWAARFSKAAIERKREAALLVLSHRPNLDAGQIMAVVSAFFDEE